MNGEKKIERERLAFGILVKPLPVRCNRVKLDRLRAINLVFLRCFFVLFSLFLEIRKQVAVKTDEKHDEENGHNIAHTNNNIPGMLRAEHHHHNVTLKCVELMSGCTDPQSAHYQKVNAVLIG